MTKILPKFHHRKNLAKKKRKNKNRRRFVDEDNVIGHRLKRKLTDFTCGRCDQANHNIRSCKNIGVPIRPKKYVAPPTSNEDDHLLSLDKQALNEAEEAVARVQQDPVEINLSQPNLSQDSDIELMVNICHNNVFLSQPNLLQHSIFIYYKFYSCLAFACRSLQLLFHQ